MAIYIAVSFGMSNAVKHHMIYLTNRPSTLLAAVLFILDNATKHYLIL